MIVSAYDPGVDLVYPSLSLVLGIPSRCACDARISCILTLATYGQDPRSSLELEIYEPDDGRRIMVDQRLRRPEDPLSVDEMAIQCIMRHCAKYGMGSEKQTRKRLELCVSTSANT